MSNGNIFIGWRNCWCGKRAKEGEIAIWNTRWVVLAFSDFLFCLNFKGKRHLFINPDGQLYESESVAEYWPSPCPGAWLRTEPVSAPSCDFPTYQASETSEENQYAPLTQAQPAPPPLSSHCSQILWLRVLFSGFPSCSVTSSDLLSGFTSTSSAPPQLASHLPGLLTSVRLPPLRKPLPTEASSALSIFSPRKRSRLSPAKLQKYRGSYCEEPTENEYRRQQSWKLCSHGLIT